MTARLHASEISYLIESRIRASDLDVDFRCEGSIISSKDDILSINGLESVMFGEMVEFPGGLEGLAFNLNRDSVDVAALGSAAHLKEGMKARATGRMLEVPVGPNLLGRVVDARGIPRDGRALEVTQRVPVERKAPGVLERESVSEPCDTGIVSINAMVPIGLGQRELIIGDRQTGKTSLAIDTIIHQKNTGVKCIYVAIGQKAASVAAIVHQLKIHDAMDHTIVVAATASDAAALQYIAPYAGCAMGEYFRDRGENALIIYDDLTRHAWAYRQISLLLRRPPGREAYPGDIFYLHSRLLERASRVTSEYVEQMTQGTVCGKTGSLTALPIIETQSGDVSAFIPTNVISITDGQIFLNTNLFNAGIRPAIDPGLSVSRVGGAAQTKIIKKLSSRIRIALAQYRELEAFSQFASELDEITRKQLERGQRIMEILKQPCYATINVSDMAFVLFALDSGYLDAVPLKKVSVFIEDLKIHLKYEQSHVLQTIAHVLDLNDDIRIVMKKTLDEFIKNYGL